MTWMSLQILSSDRSLDIDRRRSRNFIEDRLIEDTIPTILIRDATIDTDLDIRTIIISVLMAINILVI